MYNALKTTFPTLQAFCLKTLKFLNQLVADFKNMNKYKEQKKKSLSILL